MADFLEYVVGDDPQLYAWASELWRAFLEGDRVLDARSYQAMYDIRKSFDALGGCFRQGVRSPTARLEAIELALAALRYARDIRPLPGEDEAPSP